MKAKLERAYSFILKYFEITVWVQDVPNPDDQAVNSKNQIMGRIVCLMTSSKLSANNLNFN